MAGETIVLIEDDRDISTTLNSLLSGAGYQVVAANNGIEGQKLIESEHPAVVVTDMMMPRMGGFPVLDFINTLDVKPAVIMMTANEGGRHKAYAEMLGVVDYLRKPFAPEALLDSVRKAIDQSESTEVKSPKKKPSARSTKAVDEMPEPEPGNEIADDESEAGPLGPLRRSRKK